MLPWGWCCVAWGAADYSWVGPLPDVPSLVGQPAGAEAVGPWSAIVEKLAQHPGDARLRVLALEARTTVDAVGGGYARLLDALTAEQQRALARPQPDLVDPFFPGINGDTHPLIDYCASALADGGVQAIPADSRPGGGTWTERALPMPQAMFWGITRLALGIDGSLAPEQKGRLLGLLHSLAESTVEYHRHRVALWQHLDLPPQEPRPQVFAFPAAQELLGVRRALAPLAGDGSAPAPPRPH